MQHIMPLPTVWFLLKWPLRLSTALWQMLGHHGPAIITGGPVRDRMKHLYRHFLGKPALSSSIQNDVKLPYCPRPVLTAIPGEEFNILIEDLALSDDDD